MQREDLVGLLKSPSHGIGGVSGAAAAWFSNECINHAVIAGAAPRCN
jgi:hypothetical protein